MTAENWIRENFILESFDFWPRRAQRKLILHYSADSCVRKKVKVLELFILVMIGPILILTPYYSV